MFGTSSVIEVKILQTLTLTTSQTARKITVFHFRCQFSSDWQDERRSERLEYQAQLQRQTSRMWLAAHKKANDGSFADAHEKKLASFLYLL